MTVTAKDEAALNTTVAKPPPDASPTVKLVACQPTVGGASLSVIVTVVLLGVPSAALFGLFSVTVKVLFGSPDGSSDDS